MSAMHQSLKYLKSYWPKLHFAIDSAPEFTADGYCSGQSYHRLAREYQHLTGWCFFPYAHVQLQLQLGDLILDSSVPKEEREDVAVAFPYHAVSHSSGFSLLVPSSLLAHTNQTLPLRLVAHFGNFTKVIWSYTSGDHSSSDTAPEEGAMELSRLLDQYYPNRSIATESASIDVTRRLKKEYANKEHVVSKREQDFLDTLLKDEGAVAFVFGLGTDLASGKSTWEILASHPVMKSYNVCRVSSLVEDGLSDDTLYDVTLKSLIEYQRIHSLNFLSTFFVVDWQSIKDAFLCKHMLDGGDVFHLLDDTIVNIAASLSLVEQRGFHFAMNSYAYPLYSEPHIEESLKELLPQNITPILVSTSSISEGLFDQELIPKDTPHNGAVKTRNIDLTVIVPVFNALESTKRCLVSTLCAIGENDRIIVVDDCSDIHAEVRLADFCARYERITYIRRTENGGFIEACYTGLQEATPESNLLLLNSDVVLPIDAVKKMKAAIKDNPDIALASPLSTGSFTLALQLVAGHSLEELNTWMTKEVSPRFPTVITPEGQCLFISRDAINRFGFFDKVYERGFCEESDFGMRIALHGGRLACFDSFVVFHEQSASFHRKVRDVLYEKNRSLFEARWGDYFSYLSKFYQMGSKLEGLQNAYESAFQGDYPRPSEGHKIEDVLGGTLQKSVVKRGAQRAMSLPEDSDIVFVLPSVVRGGGSLSVLQHANEMALRGERVKVISLSPVESGIYPSLVEVLDVTPEGLLELPWSEQRLIATFWSTSYPVAEVCRRNPRVQGWYYIQDYEPWFHHGHSDVVQAAEKSYELGLQMVAKTGFLKTLIEERHNVRVHKISPGIATDVFYPGQQEKNSGRPRVAALYRPETPRRGSRELLEVIEVAHQMLPELEFTLFGSTGGLPQKLVGSVRLAGKISQRDVAELYRTTDIVVDLSHWHGFGRMGIEAMAAGAVPVLSDSGGIHEYAINGENSIVCDPSNLHRAAEAICNLALDREYRLRLREMAISTAEKLTESRATDDWLNLLSNNQRASSGIHCTGTRGAYSHG